MRISTFALTILRANSVHEHVSSCSRQSTILRSWGSLSLDGHFNEFEEAKKNLTGLHDVST